MSERWYKEAVIYCVDVDTFQDSDGDGCGDLRGLISRLDYLSRLGVTCLWLNPIHPSPNRDDGYDVADYYGVEPRLGSLGDFAELALEARERGIRIVLDLVVNHTSDQHPWFQSAISDPDSTYRDWYVWSADEPSDRRQGIVFPGEQTETWTWQKQAEAWYYHRFYDFQPDLNWSNPAVREEIKKVMGFWLQLGASGFRVDAAPFVLEQVQPGVDPPPKDFAILDDWRQDLQWRQGDAVLLCEANVEPDQVVGYLAGRPDGPNDRAHMMFNFLLNPRMWLALARADAEPVIDGLRGLPALPAMGQWATFLRNHDELDLSRLTKEQQQDVFRAFAPKPDMRLFDRGVRRRLAPMLGGDRRHIELAYSLQLSAPGTPVLRYGEEIGMGEDLSLPGRDAIRTPMQWDSSPGAGFSTASPDRLVQPVSTRGRFGNKKVNVLDQERDHGSLLSWFERALRTLRECPEVGVGTCTVVDVPLPRSVLAHRFDAPEGAMLFLHNLADTPVTIDIGKHDGVEGKPLEVFADGAYSPLTSRLTGVDLRGWGYRWIRLRRSTRD
ncbi:MAG: alpha-amylase family protein [Actinomycetes bacterium]